MGSARFQNAGRFGDLPFNQGDSDRIVWKYRGAGGLTVKRLLCEESVSTLFGDDAFGIDSLFMALHGHYPASTP